MHTQAFRFRLRARPVSFAHKLSSERPRPLALAPRAGFLSSTTRACGPELRARSELHDGRASPVDTDFDRAGARLPRPRPRARQPGYGGTSAGPLAPSLPARAGDRPSPTPCLGPGATPKYAARLRNGDRTRGLCSRASAITPRRAHPHALRVVLRREAGGSSHQHRVPRFETPPEATQRRWRRLVPCPPRIR